MIGGACILLAVYYYWSNQRHVAVLLLFFVMTGGFQLLPLHLINFPSFGVSKPYDWVFLFAGIVFLAKPQTLLDAALWKKSWVVMLYVAFLVILLYYSLFVKDIEVPVALRVFRNCLFFIILFLFIPLSADDMKAVWKLVIYITTAASVLYCCQLLVHRSLLNNVTSDWGLYMADSTVNRYYNIPVFICPVVFFLFFSKNTFHLSFKNLLLGINILAIVLTQHRNLIIAVLGCFFLWLILNNAMKRAAVVYCLLVPVLYFAADGLLNNRLSKGMEDIGDIAAESGRIRFSEIALSDLSTTGFRQYLFMERLNYIKKDGTSLLLGIGLMTDDSQKAKPLRFYIGIPDEEGNISQIANVDIAWASLLLQTGLIGTGLFVFIHLFFLRGFYLRRTDHYMQVGLLYVVSLFVSSFYGSIISMPYTACMVMLFAAYYFSISDNTEII